MSFSGPALLFTVFLSVGLGVVLATAFRRRTALGFCMAGLLAGLWVVNFLNIPHMERLTRAELGIDSAIIKDLALISLLLINSVTWSVLGYDRSRWGVALRWLMPAGLAALKIISWWGVRGQCSSPIGYEFDRCAIAGSDLYALGEGAMYVVLAVSSVATTILATRGRDLRTAMGALLVFYIVAFSACVAWLIAAAAGVGHIVLDGHLPGYQLVLRPLLSTVATILMVIVGVLFPWYLTATRAMLSWQMRSVWDCLDVVSTAPESSKAASTEWTIDHLKLALSDQGVTDLDDDMSRKTSMQTAMWLTGQGPAPTGLPLGQSRRAQRRWLLWVAEEIQKRRQT